MRLGNRFSVPPAVPGKSYRGMFGSESTINLKGAGSLVKRTPGLGLGIRLKGGWPGSNLSSKPVRSRGGVRKIICFVWEPLSVKMAPSRWRLVHWGETVSSNLVKTNRKPGRDSPTPGQSPYLPKLLEMSGQVSRAFRLEVRDSANEGEEFIPDGRHEGGGGVFGPGGGLGKGPSPKIGGGS